MAGVLLPTVAFAGDALAPGDGSWAENPALFSPVPIAAADWTPATAPGRDFQFNDLDWSLTAKGAFSRDSGGDRFKASFEPSVTFNHPGTRFGTSGKADATISRTGFGPLRVENVLLSGTSFYEIAPLARLETSAALSLTQDDLSSDDIANGVSRNPLEVSGTLSSSYTQTLGRLDVSLTGTADRDVFGPTTLASGVSSDNTSQNNTRFGGGLRLGFDITPVVQVFADAEVTRTRFDAASPTLLTRLDGTQYALKAGFAATWNPTLSASADIGVGIERFDDPTLADVRATLYDLSLTYRPLERLTLTGAFDTTIGAPGPSGFGTARIEYAATATAAYEVNDWLGWRLSAAWHEARYAGSTATDRGYALGVGADYQLNRRVKLSADYSFEHSEVTPNAPDDTHTVTFGMTLRK
jgi:hypothetical protein